MRWQRKFAFKIRATPQQLAQPREHHALPPRQHSRPPSGQIDFGLSGRAVSGLTDEDAGMWHAVVDLHIGYTTGATLRETRVPQWASGSARTHAGQGLGKVFGVHAD